MDALRPWSEETPLTTVSGGGSFFWSRGGNLLRPWCADGLICRGGQFPV
ncbi:hypothetical protein SAMN05421737_11278 [Shouchella lonarensis]|uniref:Uncharacterized protein n=1 Tax=Shouchella lonarensis TaxID=1464122 RepID=A0A1G6NGU3_9BACI|nr:hypothetical protein SAMN05421737_11278 [Shouchella lonarensis]